MQTNKSKTKKTIRFLMVGGFLGAGKTTTIGKLASRFVADGKNVALVTNDQAYDLVDTQTLRSQGFDVGEVPGACFCCNFDELVGTVDSLSEEQIPDIVIAEPVGSCTDLVATVIMPMRELFGDRFEMGPLVVLLKPEHGRRIFADPTSKTRRGFSPKAEYIFLKQLEEADSIVINKADKLTAQQQQGLLDQVARRYPDVPAVCASSRDEINFEQVIDLFNQPPRQRTAMMDVDYDVYAEGEAELGWLNCKVSAVVPANTEDPQRKDESGRFSLDDLVLQLVRTIGDRLTDRDCEIAHLKILGQTMHDTAVANRVSGAAESELSLASQINTHSADLLVNARVAASPDILRDAVQDAAAAVGPTMNVALRVGSVQSFRPAKPEPTHRKQ